MVPFLRDAKWDIPPVESNYLPNYNTELHGTPEGNFFRFLNPPSTAADLQPFQTLQLQLPKFDHIIPFQVTQFSFVSSGLYQFKMMLIFIILCFRGIINFNAVKGSIKESNQSPKSAGPDDQNQPFYSFLPSKEPAKETLQDLSIERGDKDEDDGIDLNLKLSST